MMSLATIRSMSESATQLAAKNKKVPYVAFSDNDEGVFGCPNLGDYIPLGWERIDVLFVDASGFGSENEPALTKDQFLNKVESGLGYAIVESGQFQVYIGVYRKTYE